MFYYIDNNKQRRGPFRVNQLLAFGITGETYVWRKGMQNWTKAKYVPELSRFFVRVNNVQPSQSPCVYTKDTVQKQVQSSVQSSIQNSTRSNATTKVARKSKFGPAFQMLSFSVLFFVGAGLVTWFLIWFFTDSEGGRIKVYILILPFILVWYGLKCLYYFFKIIFS